MTEISISQAPKQYQPFLRAADQKQGEKQNREIVSDLGSDDQGVFSGAEAKLTALIKASPSPQITLKILEFSLNQMSGVRFSNYAWLMGQLKSQASK